MTLQKQKNISRKKRAQYVYNWLKLARDANEAADYLNSSGRPYEAERYLNIASYCMSKAKKQSSRLRSPDYDTKLNFAGAIFFQLVAAALAYCIIQKYFK